MAIMAKLRNPVPFHVHIQSLDSASTPEDFAAREKELETGAIAVTDHGWLGAVPKTYELAKKNGLIFIPGIEGYMRDDDCDILKGAGIVKTPDKEKETGKVLRETFRDYRKYFHFCLHCQDEAAYRALGSEVSWSFENRSEKHGSEIKPLMDWKQLERLGAHNVTLSSGCLIGVVGAHLMEGQPDIARKYYERMRGMVKPGNFYVEMFPHRCTHYWDASIYFQKADGTELRLPRKKRLAIEIQTRGGPERIEPQAEEFAIMYGALKRDGQIPKLIAKKNYHIWEDLEPMEIHGVRSVEDFMPNECSPYSPDGDLQLSANKFILELARTYKDPVVISDDSHFAKAPAKLIQDMKLKSHGGSWHFHNSYHRMGSDEAWPHFRDTMGVSERDYEEWLDNGYAFRDKFKDFKFNPKVSLPTSRYPADTLKHLKSLIDKHGRMDWADPTKVARLKQEVVLLQKNGYADLLPYFFLCEEVIDAYRASGQLVGPGRGSAAGLLTNYLLGVTSVDPMRYELSVDRFLTPERAASGKMPDVDMDLPDRDFLLDLKDGWLFKNFGDKAAAITTKTGLRVKSAIKDVFRAAFGSVPYEIEALTRKIPDPPQGINDEDFVFGYTSEDGKEVKGHLDENEDLKKMSLQYPAEWQTVVAALGLARSWSRHASAYVVADVPVHTFLPTWNVSGYRTTQYDMTGVEAHGGMKFDFLGLNTLKWIGGAIRLVQERHAGGRVTESKTIDRIKVLPQEQVYFEGKWYFIWNLPDDQDVYHDICENRTETVFQLNTKSAQKWMKEFNYWKDEKARLKSISRIEDVANFTALDRPGPLDAYVTDPETDKRHNMLQEYARRSRGIKPVGEIPALTALLPKENGVLVTQEGLEKVYKALTGCSGSEATEFRTNIAKKKMEKVNAAYPFFMERATAKVGEETAKAVWEQLVTFGQYGFNLSHSTCYSVIAYACAFLKHHYPLEWWSAVLSNEDKKKIFEKHWVFCKKYVLPPDLQFSQGDFNVEGEKIRMPVGFISGIGPVAHEEILAARPYKTIRDFCQRLYDNRCARPIEAERVIKGEKKLVMVPGRSGVHAGIVGTLILSGAMDSLFEPNLTMTEKIHIFQTINAEVTKKKAGKSKVIQALLDIDYIGQYQARKRVFPVSFESLLTVLCDSRVVDGLITTETPRGKVNSFVPPRNEDTKCFWSQLDKAKIGIGPRGFALLEGLGLRYFNDEFKCGGMPIVYGAFVYVQSCEEFTYVREKQIKHAFKILADSSGDNFEFVMWGDRKTGKLQPFDKEVKAGQIVFVVLERYSDNGKSANIQAITVIKDALAGVQQEESAS
jgi:DNA polymerase III alpha subunit